MDELRYTLPQPGWIVWITGLPGAGKTVIAREVAHLLRSRRGASIVSLDGDELRMALAAGARYLPSERLALAQFYARLAKLLANQGHTVICSTVSMFEDVRTNNRATSRFYFEVFVEAPKAVREARRPLAEVSDTDLVSIDNESYQLPQHPDLIIENAGAQTVGHLARLIVERLRKAGY
jgi:cytidine diphosphoramidate kinase